VFPESIEQNALADGTMREVSEGCQYHSLSGQLP
jgi:hypothetical protein